MFRPANYNSYLQLPKRMKLYHKNTDIEVKVGDVFHLSGADWSISYINIFDGFLNLFYSSKDHVALSYVLPNELGMEWR